MTIGYLWWLSVSSPRYQRETECSNAERCLKIIRRKKGILKEWKPRLELILMKIMIKQRIGAQWSMVNSLLIKYFQSGWQSILPKSCPGELLYAIFLDKLTETEDTPDNCFMLWHNFLGQGDRENYFMLWHTFWTGWEVL